MLSNASDPVDPSFFSCIDFVAIGASIWDPYQEDRQLWPEWYCYNIAFAETRNSRMDSGVAYSWLVGKEAQGWFTDSNIQEIDKASRGKQRGQLGLAPLQCHS